MSEQEDISFDDAPAEKVVAFFETPIAEAVKPALPGPESVDELAETPMAWAELCEGMLRELHQCTEKRKFFKNREDELKAETRKFLGLDRGMIQRGEYGVNASDVRHTGEVNWKAAITAIKFFVEDQIGKEATKQIDAIVEQQRNPGFTTVKLIPYKIGSEPKEE